MALPMEELHIWLIIIKIMEHNKAPSKQLIKVASRSWWKWIWLDDTKLTSAKTRWKSPCNASWKNPTCIYIRCRGCVCAFFHRKKIKSGCDVEAADTEEFHTSRGDWGEVLCPVFPDPKERSACWQNKLHHSAGSHPASRVQKDPADISAWMCFM